MKASFALGFAVLGALASGCAGSAGSDDSLNNVAGGHAAGATNTSAGTIHWTIRSASRGKWREVDATTKGGAGALEVGAIVCTEVIAQTTLARCGPPKTR